jgi:hypothetical protein
MGFLNQVLTLLVSYERVTCRRALPAGVEFIDVKSALGIFDAPQTGCVEERVLAPTQQRARTPSLRRKTALIAPGEEVEPEDLRGNHYRRARLGNWRPDEANTGQVIARVQGQVRRGRILRGKRHLNLEWR